jgi:hypothetical protein
MRLWSIHPAYLDRLGLLALWREGLLASKVIQGKTAGYGNHPQLERFYSHGAPFKAINAYLRGVWLEAESRGYKFDRTKYAVFHVERISVTTGQLEYELEHLKKKLKQRDAEKYEELLSIGKTLIRAHPFFVVVEGDVESWERV